MSKFQKGDIVRIVKKTDGWSSDGRMDKYLGHVVEVEDVDEFLFYILRYKEDCPWYSPKSLWGFRDDEAELVYRPSDSGKTYDDGLNDMYDAVNALNLHSILPLTGEEIYKLFGTYDTERILEEYSARQIVNTIKAFVEDKVYGARKKVNDLAEEIGINRLYAIVKELRGE